MKNIFCVLISLLLATSSYGADNKNYKEAEIEYRKAVDCIHQKDADNGILHLEKSIELGFLDNNPDPGDVYGMLGGMYAIKGLKDKAKKYTLLALDSYKKELRVYEQNNDYEMINNVKGFIVKMEQRLQKLEQ